MPEPITIKIEQSRRYLAGDTIRLVVDGEPDTVANPVWGSDRSSLGYGHGRYGRDLYGRGRSLRYGVGAWGRGLYGQGARLSTIQTARRHAAADYQVGAQAADRLGNAGQESPPIAVPHRPRPPAVNRLRVSGSAIVWDWADTAT